jgi:phage-related minor tail protein
MAEATFTLRAVDSTKQAFASVQNKLSSLQKTAKTVSVGLATFFGFSAAIGGVKRLDAFLEDAEKNAKKLGLTSGDLDKLTIATDFADQAAMQLQTTAALAAAKLAGAFSSGDIAAKAFEIRMVRAKDAMKPLNDEAADLQRQFDDLGKSESVMASEAMDRAKAMQQEANTVEGGDPIEAARKRNQARKIELDATKALIEIDKKYAASLEAFGVAQSKLYEGNVSASERLVGLRAQEYELLKQVSSADKSVATEGIEKLVKLYEKINDLQIEQGRLSMEAGAMIAQSFEDAILSGQKLGEVVRSLGRDLVRLVFSQLVTQSLATGIGDAIKGAFGFRAMGGPVASGSPYVVGEKGPELFVPHASGTIVPNNKMANSGGGGTGSVTVNYNIAAGVSRAELAPILEQERRRLKAEIPDMVRRGGGYRAAFA